MKIANVFGNEWDATEDREGYGFRDAWIGQRLGAELLGGSVYEVDPGKKLWPYHTHHANEEWILVLSGRPTLRTPEGEQELVEGDVACFLRGADGAHQVINRTAEPVRVLMLSTMVLPEIVEYVDTGKVGTRSARGERLFLARPGEPAEYWEGES